MLKEFKEFAVKGNAFDLAVGVIIGAAFGGIVSSLVKDIIMPPISALTGATLVRMARDPDVNALVRSIMSEAECVGKRLELASLKASYHKN